jgi:hypothetical protein
MPADGTDAGAFTPDVFAQQGKIGELLHILRAAAMLRYAYAVDDDRTLRSHVDLSGIFDIATRKSGVAFDGCEFVICFDDGHADEFNTLLVCDWFAHTPPDVLAKNFGVPAQTFAKIPLHNLWIFQGTAPGDLAADRAAIQKDAPVPPHPFIFPLDSSRPLQGLGYRHDPGCRQHQFQGLNHHFCRSGDC